LTTIADPPTRPRWRRPLLTGLAVAITLGLLYWVLRGTSLAEVVAHLRAARPAPLIVAVTLATATFLLRTARWRVLLRTKEGGPLPWSALWHATAMGFMANNTLPLRLGELVRSYAASRLGGVSLTAALSSIAVERALDALTLVGLLALALFQAGLPADTVVATGVGDVRLDAMVTRAGILCIVVFAGALFVVLFPLVAERLIRLLVPFRRMAERLVALVEGLRQGFGALRSPGRLGAAVFWSITHWLLNGAAFYVAFAAFGIQVGFAGALLVQSLLTFGIAAPSTPGYFGVFELVVAGALALFGVPTDLGVAYGITYHITTFVPITLLGLWSLARTGLRVRDATGTST
jgi:uncharacterized protein (TIRG00374 family)